MDYVRLAILAVTIGVGFIASAQTPTKGGPAGNVAVGKELFRQRCSTCHGLDAKGTKGAGLQGPMGIYDPQSIDPARRVPPADLTTLSEQNSGKFPADRVGNAIYFKGPIPAHGTPDMPAWGDVFYSLKSNPKLLEKRVRDLTAYIESIQATPEGSQHDMDHHGENVMGFSQTKTTHHFLLTQDGGAIQVSANDPKDAVSQGQIRMHLPHIASAFASGDFADPMEVHGQTPPGVPMMQRLKAQIQYKFEATDTGGRVLIHSDNAEAIDAIHEFLRFQIREHRTGDTLKVK